MSDYDRITQLNHDNSPLLQLPGELRNRIYKFVLHYHLPIYVDIPALEDEHGNSVPRENTRRMLALLYTCRQIHSEASMMYYALNTFQFELDTSLIECTSSLTAEQLNAVKSIDMTGELVEEIEMRAEHHASDSPRLHLDTLTSLQKVSIYPYAFRSTPINLDVIGVYLREATGRMGLEVIEVKRKQKPT
ncbi:uncharacterized protein J4E78_004363 [Alternaria triticimaculans]|uniref:uncharacterized protein n=1 Tax=Alternaria triticimaculans TaxID=297637 RepID=UPI0020C43793|nr:uncharacterized protein J4E78_004363 [Alternaria triticimaculans]KAI4661574.1 hypothetical protein J4E78_004363 [Alternaria triticimaculans]